MAEVFKGLHNQEMSDKKRKLAGKTLEEAVIESAIGKLVAA